VHTVIVDRERIGERIIDRPAERIRRGGEPHLLKVLDVRLVRRRADHEADLARDVDHERQAARKASRHTADDERLHLHELHDETEAHGPVRRRPAI
jgi:hypothetical protein